MQIPGSHCQVGVAQKFLYTDYGSSFFQKVCTKGVPQHMGTDIFFPAQLAHRFVKTAIDIRAGDFAGTDGGKK
jgi:hypothetical protein